MSLNSENPDVVELVDRIVHDVRNKHILSTNYTEYFAGVPSSEISHSMMKENMFNREVQQRLKDELGFARTIVYLTFPNKLITWNQIPSIEPSQGHVPQTLNNLLLEPDNQLFEELPHEFFQETLVKFERFAKRRTVDSDNLAITTTQEAPPMDIAENEAATENFVLKLVQDVLGILSFAGINVSCSIQRLVNANTSNWSHGLNYPQNLYFGTIKPNITINCAPFGQRQIIPIEVKQNILPLVQHLQDGTVVDGDSLGMIRQSFLQMIGSKSSILMITDYFRSVLLILDCQKILSKYQLTGEVSIFYQFKVVDIEDFPLTTNGLLTWMMFNYCKVKTEKEIIKEREQLLKIFNLFLRNENDARVRELNSNSSLLNQLRNYDLIETNDQDIQLLSNQKANPITTTTIDNSDYAKIFRDSRELNMLDGVVIRIIDPTDSELQDLGWEIPYIFEKIIQCVEISRKIEQYNFRQQDQEKIIKIPRLLKYGSIAIWNNEFGPLRLSGLYIAIERVKPSRELGIDDIRKINKLVPVYKKELNLKHELSAVDLERTFIAKGDDIYFVFSSLIHF